MLLKWQSKQQHLLRIDFYRRIAGFHNSCVYIINDLTSTIQYFLILHNNIDLTNRRNNPPLMDARSRGSSCLRGRQALVASSRLLSSGVAGKADTNQAD